MTINNVTQYMVATKNGAQYIVPSKSVAITSLQAIAIIVMVIDHIGKAFYPDVIWFQVIGRIGMPMWPYFVVFGYRHTHNLKKYMERILIVAIAAQVPYQLLHGPELNEVFSLFAGLLVISRKDIKTSILVYVICLGFNYFFGMTMWFINCIIVYYFVKERFQSVVIVLFFCIFALYNHPHQLFGIYGLVLIENLKEYVKYIPRWLKLGIYPIHYTIIYLLTLVIK